MRVCESEIQARKALLWKGSRAGGSSVLQLGGVKEGRGANRDMLELVDEKLSYTGSVTQENQQGKKH